MATTRVKLTKTVVETAKDRPDGDVWIWDLELLGFGVRVQPGGRKTFCIRYRNAMGTQRKMTLARCGDMVPEQARTLARRKFAEVAEGRDPAGEKQAAKVAPAKSVATVEKMFAGYVASMRAKGKVSADEVERMLLLSGVNAADDLVRDRPAADVQPGDVIRHVSRFFKAGHRGAADKARSYIASAYAWGIASANDYTVEHRLDWGITRNPAADVAKDAGAVTVRDRNLSADELRQAWNATIEGDGFSLEVGACIRVLLGCGQRVQETLRLEGAELDLDAALWKMPAHKTKGRKHPHTIPLPAVIIPTLRALVAKHGDGWLFPSRGGSEEPIIAHTSVNHAIARWLAGEDVDIPHFQTRDLRRTWKSRGHDAGIDRFTRDLIQQHAKSDTGSKNYDRSDYGPQMREAMGKWSSWLGIVLAGGTPPEYGQPLIRAVA